MIREINASNALADFINSFVDDPIFSDPHMTYDKGSLLKSFERENTAVLEVSSQNRVIGLFVFFDFDRSALLCTKSMMLWKVMISLKSVLCGTSFPEMKAEYWTAAVLPGI